MTSLQPALLEQEIPDQIRSKPCPACFVCGALGEHLHEGVTDRLFGAPGVWNFKRCSNSTCGLVWLDPMPQENDIGMAYSNYYTHRYIARSDRRKRPAEFVERVLRNAHNLVFRTTPVHRERERLALMYVGGLPPGRILDVGCGNGNRLARFRELGWEVEGQEVDAEAAAVARRVFGLTVHLGRLEEAAFPSDRFDVITMSHVIEHLHDPVTLLRECRRVLKKDGSLVVATPNPESFGHSRFGAAWRGLEPPRHLYLFSSRALHNTAVQAGFAQCDVWTTAANASGFVLGSYENKVSRSGQQRAGANLKRRIRAALYQFQMSLAQRRRPLSGEECVLRATK